MGRGQQGGVKKEAKVEKEKKKVVDWSVKMLEEDVTSKRE